MKKLKEKINILQQQLEIAYAALKATQEYKTYKSKQDMLVKLKQDLAFQEVKNHRYVYPNEKHHEID